MRRNSGATELRMAAVSSEKACATLRHTILLLSSSCASSSYSSACLTPSTPRLYKSMSKRSGAGHSFGQRLNSIGEQKSRSSSLSLHVFYPSLHALGNNPGLTPAYTSTEGIRFTVVFKCVGLFEGSTFLTTILYLFLITSHSQNLLLPKLFF